MQRRLISLLKQAGPRPACFFVFFAILFSLQSALAFDFNFSGSRSSQSISRQIGLSHKFLTGPRLSANYSNSKDTTNSISDPVATSFKFSLATPIFTDATIRLGLRTIDDMYDFNGTGLDLRYAFPIFKKIDANDANLETELHLRFDHTRKDYANNSDEAYSTITVFGGINHEWTSEFSLSADLSVAFFASQGKELARAFDGRNSSDANIQATVEGLTFISPSVGAEYAWNKTVFGASLSRSLPKLANQPSTTNTEVYIGLPINELMTVDLSVARGRTEGSQNVNTTIALGFGLSSH